MLNFLINFALHYWLDTHLDLKNACISNEYTFSIDVNRTIYHTSTKHMR